MNHSVENIPIDLIDDNPIIDRIRRLCNAVEPTMRALMEEGFASMDVRCGPTTDALIKVFAKVAPHLHIRPLESLYIESDDPNVCVLADFIKQLRDHHNLTTIEAYSYFVIHKMNKEFPDWTEEEKAIMKTIGNFRTSIPDFDITNIDIKRTVAHVLAQVDLPSGSPLFVDLNAWQFGLEKFDYVSIWTSVEEMRSKGLFPIATDGPFEFTHEDTAALINLQSEKLLKKLAV